MGKRLSFSAEILTLEHVGRTQRDMENSLRFYYTAPGLGYRDAKFVGYSVDEIREELEERLTELDRSSALAALAALEASFRTDFLVRCYNRWKDDLSRQFRILYREKGNHVRLEDDILNGWKEHEPSLKAVISDIVGAFRYRHWLAHGRYWVPKLGQRYDFFSVYLLAQQMQPHF
jgi:hypothetical protein